MIRRDCLRDCNDKGVPLEDFKLTFCDRCLQPECTRSTYGTSKFDQRTQHWLERLFTEVPRMDPSDSRFAEISCQRFNLIDLPVNSEPGGGSDWIDPRDSKPEKVSIAVPSGFPSAPESTVQEPLEPVVAPAVPKAQLATQSKAPSNLPREVLLMNTGTNEGLYLPGAPASPVEKPGKKDPWAAPEPIGPNEILVQKGAKVRLGGGSGVK